MKIVSILFLALLSIAFSQDFAIGGSTCDFAEGGGCSVQANSAIVDFTTGVNVDSGNECVDGAGAVRGVSYSFDVETANFWSFSVQGLGGDAALLVFSGDADAADGCSAWLTIQSTWFGWTEAGNYTAVVTYNNGDADACFSFTAVGAEAQFDFTGSTDMEIQTTSSIKFCGEYSLASTWVGSFEFTPTSTVATHYNGAGILVSDEEGFALVAAVFPTADLPEDLTDNTTACALYSEFAIDFDSYGYELEVGTSYTIFVFGINDVGEKIEGDIYLNFQQSAPTIEEECDQILAEPKDFKRPSIPAFVTTDVCEIDEESPAQHVFDVLHVSYEDDVFFVVDTLPCGSNSFDGAVVLYYGEFGSEATDSEDAVAPTTCDGFVLAGDSGDGGAAYSWFPADEIITVVPTTYSSSSTGGSYSLVMGAYEIVGCIPDNPFITANTTNTFVQDTTEQSTTNTVVQNTASTVEQNTPSTIEQNTADTESSASTIVAYFAIFLVALF